MIDNKKLALVHIIKKELSLSDEEYRKILREAAQVESARDLDPEKFRKLMNFFVRSRYYQVNPFGLTMRQKLYIQYLARNLGWTSEHLGNFLHKYYRKTAVESLTKKEAIKAIESLKSVREHQGHKITDKESMKKLIILLFLWGTLLIGLIHFGGCVLFTHSEQISTLQGLAASQKEMGSYIKEQERGFKALKDDIAAKRLQQGLTKSEAVARYAEPVFCEDAKDNPGLEQCLYRNPQEYFGGESAYLYFDGKGNLSSWKFFPADNKQQE